MRQVITRFAPSPTGMLHIGNSRTALINWLYARKHNGKFILRFDDTDLERSKPEYKKAIEEDLKFLRVNWDETFLQSTRLARYESIKQLLLQNNRLYPCFETPEELGLKRKLQLAQGLPFIYDRAALQLTAQQISDYIAQGRRPHYRFLIHDSLISWQDMVKGTISYEGKNLSDPIIVRADGSLTYMLCSVIDDIDYSITDIIRGEDHVTNTAIQVQMFEALGASLPNLGHLSLVIAREQKISKRLGGFDIASLRDQSGLEPMAINSFFSLLGTSMPIMPFKNLTELVKAFELSNMSKSPTTYLPEELERLNHKLLITLSFEEVKERLQEIGCWPVTEQFWLTVRPNLQKLQEIKNWWNICYVPLKAVGLDPSFLKQAADLLVDEPITINSWHMWTRKISEVTGKKGKEVFLPLRLAITGMSSGPEMSAILTLLSREEILRRLN